MKSSISSNDSSLEPIQNCTSIEEVLTFLGDRFQKHCEDGNAESKIGSLSYKELVDIISSLNEDFSEESEQFGQMQAWLKEDETKKFIEKYLSVHTKDLLAFKPESRILKNKNFFVVNNRISLIRLLESFNIESFEKVFELCDYIEDKFLPAFIGTTGLGYGLYPDEIKEKIAYLDKHDWEEELVGGHINSLNKQAAMMKYFSKNPIMDFKQGLDQMKQTISSLRNIHNEKDQELFSVSLETTIVELYETLLVTHNQLISYINQSNSTSLDSFDIKNMVADFVISPIMKKSYSERSDFFDRADLQEKYKEGFVKYFGVESFSIPCSEKYDAIISYIDTKKMKKEIKMNQKRKKIHINTKKGAPELLVSLAELANLEDSFGKRIEKFCGLIRVLLKKDDEIIDLIPVDKDLLKKATLTRHTIRQKKSEKQIASFEKYSKKALRMAKTLKILYKTKDT